MELAMNEDGVLCVVKTYQCFECVIMVNVFETDEKELMKTKCPNCEKINWVKLEEEEEEEEY